MKGDQILKWIIGVMAITASLSPVIALDPSICPSKDCVFAPGEMCFDGSNWLLNYRERITVYR